MKHTLYHRIYPSFVNVSCFLLPKFVYAFHLNHVNFMNGEAVRLYCFRIKEKESENICCLMVITNRTVHLCSPNILMGQIMMVLWLFYNGCHTNHSLHLAYKKALQLNYVYYYYMWVTPVPKWNNFRNKIAHKFSSKENWSEFIERKKKERIHNHRNGNYIITQCHFSA